MLTTVCLQGPMEAERAPKHWGALESEEEGNLFRPSVRLALPLQPDSFEACRAADLKERC